MLWIGTVLPNRLAHRLSALLFAEILFFSLTTFADRNTELRYSPGFFDWLRYANGRNMIHVITFRRFIQRLVVFGRLAALLAVVGALAMPGTQAAAVTQPDLLTATSFAV